MWPKVIFLYPTAIVALICAAGMQIIGDRVHDPAKSLSYAVDSRQFKQADGVSFYEASAQTGSWGDRRVTLDAGQAINENVAARLNVFYEGADGPEMRKGGWQALLDRLGQAMAN